jgi:hypothetical protein
MKRVLFISLIAAFILAACGSAALRSEPDVGYGGGGAPAQDGYAQPAVEMPPAMATSDASKSFESADQAQSNAGGVQAASVERLVIQNADLSVVVADPKTRMAEIAQMAKDMGGYVVSSNLYQSYASNGQTVPEAAMTIRVPAERLDEALEKIKKDAVEVKTETRSGQDVTAEYVDLQSRLKTYEDALAQLEKIMAEKTTPEEVLDVFNQMVYYREQIELIKGQMKYYEEATALSAVSLRLIAEATLQPIEIGGWKPQGVARDAIQRLIYFWQGFVDFLINFLLYTLPVLITIGIPLYLVFLLARWVFRKVRVPKKPARPRKQNNTGLYPSPSKRERV